jgi:DNA-binding transcriptional LysR family regulator
MPFQKLIIAISEIIMPRAEDIAVFVEVAARGSFAAAARRLSRSPAAVTRAVAELEARLGVRLLTRTTRAVALTEAGQRFLAGAKRVLADLDEVERAAAGEGTAPRGELRITAPILFGRLHVLPIVLEFLRRFADVSVALSLLDRPVDLVDEGLDLAVRIGALAESSAVATRVGAVRRIAVASPEYLAQRGTPRTPADLGAHAIVAFAGVAGVDRWLFHGETAEAGIAISPRLIVTTAEAALDAAREGFGVTRVLSYQAADDIARGSLVRLLATWEGDDIPIHVVYPGGRHPPPKLRAFLDFTVPRLRRRCAAIARATNA